VLEVEGLNIRGYDEVFCFSQNQFHYFSTIVIPNFKQSTVNYRSALFKDIYFSIFKYNKSGMGGV